MTLFLRDGHDGVAEVDLREVQQVAVPSNKSTSDQVIGWGQWETKCKKIHWVEKSVKNTSESMKRESKRMGKSIDQIHLFLGILIGPESYPDPKSIKFSHRTFFSKSVFLKLKLEKKCRLYEHGGIRTRFIFNPDSFFRNLDPFLSRGSDLDPHLSFSGIIWRTVCQPRGHPRLYGPQWDRAEAQPIYLWIEKILWWLYVIILNDVYIIRNKTDIFLNFKYLLNKTMVLQ